MDKLLALLAFLAALAGCEPGRDTIVHRVAERGVDLLSSRATAEAGILRLECVRSASGMCHYLLLPSGCSALEHCDDAGRQISVDAGASRQVTGLHAFRLCVSDAVPVDPVHCSGSAIWPQ